MLARNADIVPVAPYAAISTAAGNWGSGGVASSDCCVIANNYRIRQSGTIVKAELWVASLTNVTAIYIKIWRKLGSTYWLVGVTENLLSKLIAGQTNLVTLDTPILNVLEDDFYGVRIESSSGSSGVLTCNTAQSFGQRYVTNQLPAAANYDWEIKTAQSGNLLPIKLYMQAPHRVWIGDSLTSGHYNHEAYLMVSVLMSRTSGTIPSMYARMVGDNDYTYQNMGWTGNTSTQLAARFDSDVVAIKPREVSIMVGTNDILGGIDQATALANITAMLDKCVANNIRVDLLSIPPANGWTAAQSRDRDSRNVAEANLIASSYYNYGFRYISLDRYLGQYKAGGDAGNLWDLKTSCNQGDGVHLSIHGNYLIANAVADARLQPEARRRAH